MADSNFIDYVKIHCKSGAGGAGSAHFFRAKGLPNGGPDGGDGGKGGDVILQVNPQLWTLLHLKYTKHIKADSGKNGSFNRMHGAKGADKILEVPAGTVARDAETGAIITEVLREGDRFILVPGGRGGLGNDHFKSATNQAPDYAQPGGSAEEKWIILELKVLADVGLVGLPNAGKSTLLAAVSAARPAIADYPFTTLTPNLGVVAYRDFQSFVMADIPGIIEGAHEGRGLGLRFLRHIERNPLLLFLVPCTAEDPEAEYQLLLNELGQHNPDLLSKKRILGISKMDMADEESKDRIARFNPEIPKIPFSAATGEGVQELKDAIWKMLNQPYN
jgi:GTP-binding protein